MNTSIEGKADIVLPYDSNCPVIYDNDECIDAYTDDFVMACASAERIKLIGMISSTTVRPFNRYVPPGSFDKIHQDRLKGYSIALESGMKNIPEPVKGGNRHLEMPVTGWIKDTQPINNPGSRLIVKTALEASYEKPLVVVMGGPLTVLADAYLLDNSIADKVVAAWLGDTTQGINYYNGWADPWSAYIVMEKIRMVMIPAIHHSPYVPKPMIEELPDTPMRQWMIEKYHEEAELPGKRDGDAPPLISILRSDYILEAKRVSTGYWKEYEGHTVPMFKDSKEGKTLVACSTDRKAGTTEWWNVMKDPKVWGLTE